MKILAEIAPISARILVENRSSEISDRKLPISGSVRHGFFLPSGNRQVPMGKNVSIRIGLRFDFLKIQFELTTVGMNSTSPK